MANPIPRNMPHTYSPRYPSPLGSPLHPPTPTLAAQLSYMLQQPDIQPSPSPLFQQPRHVHFEPQTPRSAFQYHSHPQLLRSHPHPQPQPQTPRSHPISPPNPPPPTPRTVHFAPSPPPQPQTPRTATTEPEPPRQLRETQQRCTRCTNILVIPPSSSFITQHLPLIPPVPMDRLSPRCVACDLTRTKELCKDIIAPAPSYIDPVAKIEADIGRMEGYLREGLGNGEKLGEGDREKMESALGEARRRLERERERRRVVLGRVWERFYGAWGPGVRGGQQQQGGAERK